MLTARPDLLEFLIARGAGTTSHSSRTLLDHLVGTCQLLEDWDAPEHVRLAGLFHSIYGTEAFGVALVPLDHRPEVRGLIGDEAEEIAYRFCAMEVESFSSAVQQDDHRVFDRFTSEWIGLSRPEVSDLLHVSIANRLEQRAGFDIGDVARSTDVHAATNALVSPAARKALEAAGG